MRFHEDKQDIFGWIGNSIFVVAQFMQVLYTYKKKTTDDISYWLNKGINFLVLGSLAVKNKELIFSEAIKNKNKLYVALDILDNKIMIKGWTQNSNSSVDKVFNFYNSSFIKGFILTDISRDGMLEGLDIKLIKNFIKKTKKDIIVGGGLSTYKDLEMLKKNNNHNLEGVIAGKSFYSGNIKIDKAINLLSSNA